MLIVAVSGDHKLAPSTINDRSELNKRLCMDIKRREFLKRSAVGLGGLLAAGPLGAVEKTTTSSASRYFDPFETVTLGKSGLKVSRVCMGTGTSGVKQQSNQTRLGQSSFCRLLRDAYERGVRTFDLADQYGTHPYLAPAMEGVPRDRYNIITKIRWHADPTPDANIFVERFLKELSTDYIDLLLIHCVTSPTWPSEMSKQMEILSMYKKKGVIRALGVSCHSMPALEAAAAEPWVDSVHTRINPYGMSMDGPPEKVVPIIKKIHAAGKGVVGMKICGAGRLRNDEEKRQQSVEYSLNLGCVHMLNVGFEKLSEVDGFAGHVRKTQIVRA
jgi:aryl-alcohol dehydrogenase-like predicted oxidoreductase